MAEEASMSLADDELVITAAIVGAEVTRAQNPHVPYSAEEIATEAARCADAGAAVIHLHVREPDGTPTQSAAAFQAAIEAIRARCDVVIQVSTGGAVGMDVEERLGGLACAPEMATLNCGSTNFGDAVFVNAVPDVRQIARRIAQIGATPELEVYEVGHLDLAMSLLDEGVVASHAWLQFVLGVPGAAGARESVLRFMISELGRPLHWSVAAVGRHQLPMAALACELGGHPRVGLEDNLFLRRGVLAEGSAPLVERAAELARERGRQVVSAGHLRGVLTAP